MSKVSQDLIATLCDRFPAAFSLKSPQLLQVGIGNEIAKMLDINPRAVGLALGFYCNRSAYLSACKEGATRVDLNGNPAGTVTEREAAHAEKLLEERRAIWRAKREARPAHAPQLAAKRPDGLMQGRAEHEAQQLRQTEVAGNPLRRQPREATVTRNKPPVVVRVSRPRLSLRRKLPPR
jgi:ProP effector